MALGKTTPLHFSQARERRIAEQREARREFNTQMDNYKNFDVGRNFYGNLENVYEGMENVYEGMQNPFEEARSVSTAAERLAGEQFAQSQRDTMASLGAAAGGSGFGALATAAGRSAQEQAAATRASISQRQDAVNMQRMQGEAARQQAVLAGRESVQRAQLDAAAQNQLLKAQGAESALQRELSKQQDLLGMAAGRKEAADQARQQNTQMWMSLAGDLAGTAMTAFAPGTP